MGNQPSVVARGSFPGLGGLSSNAIVVGGLIAVCSSQSFYFLIGNAGRLMVLAAGLALIGIGAALRARRSPVALSFYAVVVSILVMVLLGIAFVNQQNTTGSTDLIFFGICWFMFMCGLVLGSTPGSEGQKGSSWILGIMGALVLASMVGFHRFIQSEGAAGNVRQYGDLDLNPIAVAYSNTILICICVAIALVINGLWMRMLFVVCSVVAALLVVSSASRGAVIWGPIAIVCMLVVLVRQKTVRVGRVLLVVGLGIAALIIIPQIIDSQGALGARGEHLMARLEELALVFDGGIDQSTSGRERYWEYYLGRMGSWIVIGEYNYTGYPHNQFLEFAVRYGLLGCAMAVTSVWLFIKALRIGFSRQLPRTYEAAAIWTAFIYAYLQSMTSLSLDQNRVLWLGLGYILGLTLSFRGAWPPSVAHRTPRRATHPRTLV